MVTIMEVSVCSLNASIMADVARFFMGIKERMEEDRIRNGEEE